MATAIDKTQCSVCKTETSVFLCQECSQNFCWTHLNKHRQSLGEQLDQIETDHNEFRQKLIDKKTNAENHSSIQQIDQWGKDSIQIIKQTADQCREKLFSDINKFYSDLENELNDLAEQIKHVREENEFNEIDLNHLKQKLTKLQAPNKFLTVSIKQESTSFVNKIFLNITFYKGNFIKEITY